MGIGVLTALASVIGATLVGLGISRIRARRRDKNAPLIRRERRIQSRIIPTPDMPAQLKIIGNEITDVPEIKDVSTTGLAISVPNRFNGKAPEQEVEVLLKLHGEGTVRARGEIRHVSYTRHNTTTFGVEFVKISAEDRQRIERYVEKKQSRSDRRK